MVISGEHTATPPQRTSIRSTKNVGCLNDVTLFWDTMVGFVGRIVGFEFGRTEKLLE